MVKECAQWARQAYGCNSHGDAGNSDRCNEQPANAFMPEILGRRSAFEFTAEERQRNKNETQR